ncbi:MAG: hypothetical protein AAGA54_04680 [Myxococcota bacterium]
MKHRGAWVACAIALSILAPQTADACGRIRRPRPRQVDRKLAAVKKSEALLAKGKHKAAAKVARGKFRGFQAATGEADHGKALFNRAQRTIALATIRSEGAIDLGKGMRGRSSDSKALNLAWATSVLEIQAASDPDNLVLRTNYAEALTHHPGGDAQALEMLSEMANDDLMPTARGFVLLATVQQSLGDASGSDLSLQRCKELGATANVCRVA